MVAITVEGVRTFALVDTGAAVSVIAANLCRVLRKVTTPLSGLSLHTASAQQVTPLAACTARVVIEGNLYIVEFIVLSACSHDVILGWDFLSRHNAVIDCARAEVEFSPLCDAPLLDALHQPPKLLVREDTDIPPGTFALVPVSCNAHTDATVFFTPSDVFTSRRALPLPFATIDIAAGSSNIFVLNPLSAPVTLLAGECLGRVEDLDSSSLVDVPDDCCDPPNALSALGESSSDIFSSAIADTLTPAEHADLLALLHEFRNSFDVSQPQLGRTSQVQHYVDTGLHQPLRQRPYRDCEEEDAPLSSSIANARLARLVFRIAAVPLDASSRLLAADDHYVFQRPINLFTFGGGCCSSPSLHPGAA